MTPAPPRPARRTSPARRPRRPRRRRRDHGHQRLRHPPHRPPARTTADGGRQGDRRWSRRRTSGAASPRSSAATHVAGDQHHHQPGHRPARLRADRRRRADDRRRRSSSSTTGSATTLGDQAGRPPTRPRPHRARRRRRWSASADGGNPHRWYSPDDVHQGDRRRSPPTTSGSTRPTPRTSTQQQTAFETTALARTTRLIAEHQGQVRRHPGRRLGVDLRAARRRRSAWTCSRRQTFLEAISEGTDPTAADKATIDDQIADKQIKVYVYNSQNSTPDVQHQVSAAKAAGIPVTTVTETLAPGRRHLPGLAVRAAASAAAERSATASDRNR